MFDASWLIGRDVLIVLGICIFVGILIGAWIF